MIQSKEKLNAFNQRVTIHYIFTGLTNKKVCAYMSHTLEFSNGSNILMDDGSFWGFRDLSQRISHTIDHAISEALK